MLNASSVFLLGSLIIVFKSIIEWKSLFWFTTSIDLTLACFSSLKFSLVSSTPPSRKISPVSWSITSSITVDPINESVFLLRSLTSSIQLNALKISAFVEYPRARRSIVTGNFLLLSIIQKRQSFISVVKSTQDPLKGIILAWKSLVPFGWTDWSKKTPGERCNCETITLSAPFMTKVPLFVM